MDYVYDLDTPLLTLSPRDPFTLRDACNGVHVFGGIGSGKTSGSGKTLAGAYLRAGMGGLVLAAKPEEVELWRDYAKAHGRTKSVLIFDEGQGFNFITYELARHGMQGISNVTTCLMRVLEAADHASGATPGQAKDRFWEDAVRQILNYTIPLIYAAWGTVTVASIIDFVVSAAKTPAQWGNDAWVERSYAAQTIRRAADFPAVRIPDAQLRIINNYWIDEFTAIPEKTQGNILITLTTRLDRFKHGRMQRAFCDQTTIVPEMTFHGVIIVMAMPALTWNEDGIIAQHLFKFMWQRAVEARNGLEPAQRERPVFLWADEAQYFVNVKDDEFLSTCRGSRACVVFMSQTLPSYYARLGKDKSDAIDGLVGKFTTQVFHQNACTRTNQHAAELIGRGLQQRRTTNTSTGWNRNRGMNTGENTGSSTSYGSSHSYGPQHHSSSNSGGGTSQGESWGRNTGSGYNESESWGTTEQMDYLIQPNVFASELKTGGPANGRKVTAVWFKAGGRFQATSGGNVLFPTFEQ